MKPALLLLTSSLVIVASGAFAQGNSDACHNQYGSCMEHCSSRPQSLQESCSTSCEANTNQCYAGMYGGKSSAQVLPSASAPDQAAAAAEDNEASTAHDEAKTKTKKKKK